MTFGADNNYKHCAGVDGIEMDGPLDRVTRRFPRRRLRGPLRAVCYARGAAPDLALAARDISPGGIGLVTNAGLQPGQDVEIRIANPATAEELARPGTVVWSQAGETGFLTGISFQEPLSFSEFQAVATA